MSKKAILFRMYSKNHVCPYGLRSKALLKKQGYTVIDNLLTSRSEIDTFKNKHNVKTTPQTFIDEKCIGGYDDLRDFFGLSPLKKKGTSYTPVIAIFATAFLMSLAITFSVNSQVTHLFSFNVIETFIALSMAILAIQKLRDLDAFTNTFITYDLIAIRHIRYGYVYPFAEAFVGIGMLAGLAGYIVGPVSLFIGTIGAISIVKAVYIDKRALKCACVGGDSNVPLGFISLTENLLMMAAGIWMLLPYILLNA